MDGTERSFTDREDERRAVAQSNEALLASIDNVLGPHMAAALADTDVRFRADIEDYMLRNSAPKPGAPETKAELEESLASHFEIVTMQPSFDTHAKPKLANARAYSLMSDRDFKTLAKYIVSMVTAVEVQRSTNVHT